MNLLLLALLASQSTPDQAPMGLTLDVLNRQALGGHRILHLEDVIGPRRRTDIPGLPSVRGLLIFTVDIENCGREKRGLCFQVASSELFKEAKAKEGLVVALVLADEETANRARREIPYTDYPFPVALDAHGLVRKALVVDRPGAFLVINSAGRIVKLSPPSGATGWFLDKVRKTFRETLQREREEEQ